MTGCMKRRLKLLAIPACLALALGGAACGDDSTAEKSAEEQSEQAQEDATDALEDAREQSEADAGDPGY